MELEFTTDQDELRDSIRAVLAKESPVGLARKVVDDGRRPTVLWATLIMPAAWPDRRDARSSTWDDQAAAPRKYCWIAGCWPMPPASAT